MFTNSHLEVGRVKYVSGDVADGNSNEIFSVVFEKSFKSPPNVSCTVENSNKKAIALNVGTTGFDLIISDSGFDYDVDAAGNIERESEFYVHYYAILVG